MIRCAIYYSYKDETANEVRPFKERKKELSDYAKAKEWSIAKEYREQLKTHPFQKFETMKTDSFTRQFDVILAYSLDDFGKNPLVAIDLLENTFLPAGIGFCLWDIHYDSFMHSFEENKRFLVEQKTALKLDYRMAGLKDYRFNRKYNQYGYLFQEDETGKKLVVDPEASEVVKTIFGLFANGYKRAQILQYLNDKKIKTPTQHFASLGLTRAKIKCNKWVITMVSKILQSETYFGIYKQNFLGETIPMEAPVFIDSAILEKVAEKLQYEKDHPRGFTGNGGENAFSRLLVDKKTGNRITSFDRSRTTDFCLRAVVGEKVTSLIYSEEKIMFKDAVAEAKRVLHQEHKLACRAKRFFASQKGKLAVKKLVEEYQNRRIECLKELVYLNHKEMTRKLTHDLTSESYDQQIAELDCKINEIENAMKKFKVALSENNPWILLFSQDSCENEFNNMNYRKYVTRFNCIDFTRFELVPKNLEWKELIPAEWIGESIWQEKAEKMLNA